VATSAEKLSALQRQIKELTEQQEELNESADHFLDIGEKALATTSGRIALQREELDQEAKRAGLEREQISLAKQKIELQRNAQGELSAANEEALKVLEQKDEWLKQHNKVLKEQAKSLHAQKEIAEASASAFGSIASKMMISQSATAAAAKNMFVMWKNAVKVEGVIKATYKSLKAIGGSFLDIFNPINLITSASKAIFAASFEFMLKSSQAMADFAKATGDAGELAEGLGSAMNRGVGVGIQEVTAAAASLAGSWSNMADVSVRAKNETVNMAAELAKVGMGLDQTGQSVDFMTKGMGMSLPEADRTMRGLASSAIHLGMTSAQAGENFRSMASELALHGNRMMAKFTSIAATAKAMGVEMQDVVSVGEGFETFEGATSRVGDLNAYLGTTMSGLEMMKLQVEEGPDAVAKELIRNIRASGKEFEDLNRLEIKYLAQTANVSTEKFAKMMGYRDEEAELAEANALKEQKNQERHQKQLRKSVSLAESWMMTLESVFANPKLVTAMTAISETFMSFMTDANGASMSLGDKLAYIAEKFHDWLVGATANPGGLLTRLVSAFKFVIDNWESFLYGWLAWKAILLAMPFAKLFTMFKLMKGAGIAKSAITAATSTGSIVTSLPGATAGGAGATAATGGGLAAAATAAAPVIAGAAVVGAVGGAAYMGYQVHQSLREEAMNRKSIENDLFNRGLLKKNQSVEEAADALAAKRIRDMAELEKKEKSKVTVKAKTPALSTATTGGVFSPTAPKNDEKTKRARAEVAEATGKQLAAAFLKEMKENAQPVEMDFKFTFDDIMGVASPAHKVLYDSINNTLKKQTA